MRSLAVRPQLCFAAVVAFVLAAESLVLASHGFTRHPAPLRAAVIFDLCVVPALFWWLLFVRKGLTRPRTVARVLVLGVAFCALLFGREVRLLALPIELGLIYVAFTSVRGALRARASADAATALRNGLCEALGDNAAARAVAAELSVLWYAVFSHGRKAPDGFTAYKRAGWGPIYAALALATVGEAIGVHFLLRRFGPLAAFGGIALHVYVLLWLLGDLRALKLRPISVEAGVFHLRLGLRWEADIPLTLIEKVERCGAGTAIGDGRRLGVLGSPNLRIALREPVTLVGLFGVRRTASALLLQVDQPEDLAAALSVHT
jgi:hypothetical protein